MLSEKIQFQPNKQKPWQEEPTGFRKLTRFVEENAERMKKEGLPINKDGRISPEGYSTVYSQEVLDGDKKYVQGYERKFDEIKFSIRDVENSDAGEGFEILTIGIMQKFLDKDFYVLRTSKFDDICNKVDILILDKKTGAVVCGLDDVQSEEYGYRAERKRTSIRQKNEEYGGAVIRYGFLPQKDGDSELKFKLSGMAKVPIIVLPISGREIESAIESFNTDSDQKIFDKFLKTIREQLGELSRTLPDASAREKMAFLKASLNSYAKKKELVAA